MSETDLSYFSEDLLNDILVELNASNSRQMDEIDNNCLNLSKFRSNSGVVQNIISICDHFKVDDSVKYTSIELFDKLLVQLVCDTKKVFLEANQINVRKGNELFDWESIEKKLKNQMHLRAVTCVVISTKLLNTKSMTMTSVKEFLLRSGYRYSLTNINRSELRVLNLLNYRLAVNSVDIYVETILEVIKYNCLGFESYLSKFQTVAKHFIELFYICRNVIARNAFKIMAKRLDFDFNSNDEEIETERLGANKMLISSAIIVSIPIIIDVSLYERVVNEVSEISGIEDHLIMDMSHALLILLCDDP